MSSAIPPKGGNLKWWQQEIIETTKPKNIPPPIEEKTNLSKSKELVDALSRLGGPIVGGKYKIEVTGPLNIKDGTFWACPVSSGFIQDKLEPLSQLLRSSPQAEPGFKDEFDELVCVQSLENKLWMRAQVLRIIDNESVKLQFIDVGRIEDHQKNKLRRVPKLLATIPYMAFHCALFEEKFTISYEDKWRFNDLVKKKILNFTCQRINVEENNRTILFGEMETIIDKPIININEEMRRRVVNNKIPNATNNSKTKSEHPEDMHNIGGLQISSDEVPAATEKHNKIEADESSKNVVDVKKTECNKAEKLVESLLQIAGPKLGQDYKIEVTSQLNTDGTFWACPITSGFIKDRLEPLSSVLRSTIQVTPSLRNLKKFDGLLCVQSSENYLMMRGIVTKEINDKSVKILLVDVGRHEDHLKSKLFRVSESLATIPYMAFHCAIFEETVKLSYVERWRFADLCKKKLLSFTCEGFIERDNEKLVFGKMEDTAENPVINITDEIKIAMKEDKPNV